MTNIYIYIYKYIFREFQLIASTSDYSSLSSNQDIYAPKNSLTSRLMSFDDIILSCHQTRKNSHVSLSPHH